LTSITYRDLAQPTKRAKPFNHPDWIFELKHDGYRVLATKDGKDTKLISRRGNDLIGWFPEIAADLLELRDLVIDGELVMLDSEGKPQFEKLRGRCAIRNATAIAVAARSRPAALFAFDLLEVAGKDIRAQPLLKRKALLQRELHGARRIAYCQHVGEVGEKLFAKADELQLEGIIAKKADSPYRRGRTPNWVKIKTAHGRHIDEERAKEHS
jgi:bifunctional non-homologous end joining protein LigD